MSLAVTTGLRRLIRLIGLVSAFLVVLFEMPTGHCAETSDEEGPVTQSIVPNSDLKSDSDGARVCGDLGYVIFPIVFYSNETNVGAGATTVLFKKHCDPDPLLAKDDSLTAVAIFTARYQFLSAIVGNKYWLRSLLHLNPSLVVSRYPSVFHGFGNDTLGSDGEAYTPLNMKLDVTFAVNVFERIYAGLVINPGYYSLLEFNNGGLLDAEVDSGNREGFYSGLGLRLTRDTRDDTLYPRDGSLSTVRAAFFNSAFGSDYDFSLFEIDLRTYIPFVFKSIWALQFYGQMIAGDPPMDFVPKLGGANIFRGYDQGRYRDNVYSVIQAEWRIPIVWRIGATLFGAMGNVYEDLESVRLDEFKWAVGGGLRVALDKSRRVNLRFDVGVSHDSVKLYVNILEAY